MFESFELTTVSTGEVDIRVRYGGSGPPLLLLHGHPQTHAMWCKLAPRLAKEFTVVAPDLRGYGDSSKPPKSYDPQSHIRSVPWHATALRSWLISAPTALTSQGMIAEGVALIGSLSTTRTQYHELVLAALLVNRKCAGCRSLLPALRRHSPALPRRERHSPSEMGSRYRPTSSWRRLGVALEARVNSAAKASGRR